jgi:hypothetical protein
LRHDREHKASLYQFSKRLCAILKQSLISFIHCFANLSAGEPAKVCQTRKMRFQIFLRAGSEHAGWHYQAFEGVQCAFRTTCGHCPGGKKSESSFSWQTVCLNYFPPTCNSYTKCAWPMIFSFGTSMTENLAGFA